MNIKRTILTAALLACTTTAMFAQVSDNVSITTAERQQMMLKVVDLFENYERYCSIDEDFTNYVSSFRSLFISSDAPVFNDILGLSHEKSLSAREYAKLMSEQSSTTRVEISNISNHSIFYEDGKWKIKCSFDKNVNITNQCGVEFSSDFFNKADYRLDATIVYDKENGQCQFEEIGGTFEAKRQLGRDYRVVTKSSPLDDKVLYNRKPLEFNNMGQAFVSSMGKFSFPYDPEIVVKEVIDNEHCRLMHLNLTLKSWRLKPHFDIGLGNAYEMENSDLLNQADAKSNSFGLDFGYVFRTKSKLKIGLFSGVGLTISKFDLGYTNGDYYYSTNADVDGDDYVRHYNDLNLRQTIKLSEFNVPLYADLDFHFNPYIGIYADLGLKFNFDTSHKVETTEGNAYIYGIYSQYGNLRMDEHWGYNGFGNRPFSQTGLDNTELIGVSSFTMDVFGTFGMRFNIPSTPLAIDLGANYLLGLTDAVKPEGEKIELANNTRYPIVYNTISGQNSEEHVRNLTETFSSVKRKSLRFSMGVIFKF